MFKSISITTLILSGMIISANIQADESMTPPKPLDNKVYDAMVGNWKGNSNMMGTPMHDTVKIRWALNHQYLVMETLSVADKQPEMKYEGMGIFGINAQGKAKTWWFDSWGADFMSIGSGEFSGDNKLTITDGNSMFNETRSFEMQGNEMIMHAKGTVTWEGKQKPFDETTVYKKI